MKGKHKPMDVFSPDKWIAPSRLVEMAETMEPEDVAEATGTCIEDVMAALAAVGRKHKKIGICDRKTGKIVLGYTERGLYLKAQILGRVDWFYFRPEVA